MLLKKGYWKLVCFYDKDRVDCRIRPAYLLWIYSSTKRLSTRAIYGILR